MKMMIDGCTKFLIFAVFIFMLVFRPVSFVSIEKEKMTSVSTKTSHPVAKPTNTPSVLQIDHIKADDPKHVTNTWLKGIDVSYYQGKIDWNKIKQNKAVDFVYLKATEGITYHDKKYTHNANELEKLNIPYGSYHFFEPKDDGKKQAKNFLSNLQDKSILPPVLDVEISKSVDKNLIAKRVKDWLDYVEKNIQCKPIIYSYRSFWEEYLGADFADYDFWLADYAKSPKLPEGEKSWVIWQNSQSGKINGIAGNVDTDIMHGDQKKLKSLKCDISEQLENYQQIQMTQQMERDL